MSICPCPNCRTSASAVHSGLGWVLLLAIAAVVVRYIYAVVEGFAWALFIPTAVIASVMIAVVARMVLKRPTPRPVLAPARSPEPAAETAVTPPASEHTPVPLTHLDGFTVELARATAPFN